MKFANIYRDITPSEDNDKFQDLDALRRREKVWLVEFHSKSAMYPTKRTGDLTLECRGLERSLSGIGINSEIPGNQHPLTVPESPYSAISINVQETEK